MARLTDEQKAQRAAARRHREALAAEAEHERREAKQRQWREAGAYLTREELEAGESCRGCGLPVMDRLGDWPRLQDRSPEEQAEFEQADAEYSARHADCRSHRWSLAGSRSQHCGECCPPHPLHQSQIEQLAAILRGHRPDPEQLDTWRLSLTCAHTVDATAHRSSGRWVSRVMKCPTCDRPSRRGRG